MWNDSDSIRTYKCVRIVVACAGGAREGTSREKRYSSRALSADSSRAAGERNGAAHQADGHLATSRYCLTLSNLTCATPLKLDLILSSTLFSSLSDRDESLWRRVIPRRRWAWHEIEKRPLVFPDAGSAFSVNSHEARALVTEE